MQLIDKEKIRESLKVVTSPGQVFEIRVLDAVTNRKSFPHTISGYFNDAALAADAIEQAEFRSFGGLYWTLNPVRPELLGRAVNKLRPAGKDSTTSDDDVQSRRWLLVDCDPVRPAGISSSDEEHALANERGNAVDAYLYELGFPPAIFADSGNGRHLLYAIDVPAKDDGLIEQCLTHLAKEFDDEGVKIDTTVFNPGRICRLYGAINGKGDADADKMIPPRPHRMAQIVQVPHSIELVPEDALRRLAASATIPDETTPEDIPRENNNVFNLEGLLAKAKFDIKPPVPYKGGWKWLIPICPWNPDHTNSSAFVIQRPDGPIQAGCHHNGCRHRRWHDLRAILDPGWNPSDLTGDKPSRGRETHTCESATTQKLGGITKLPTIPPWKPFPTNSLPEAMAGYVREVASSMKCDESMVAIPLLVVFATAIGATRKLRLSHTWFVPSILWGCIVAESGSKKTQPLMQCRRLLGSLEQTAKQEYEERLAIYEREKLIYDADMAAWKHRGRKNGEPAPDKPAEPVRRRYLFDNVTLEALAKLLKNNSRGMGGLIDELGGWMGSFGEYKGGKGSGDASRWLEIYNGNPTIIDRVDRTIDFPRSAVSICGGIQPASLQRALGKEHLENGLAARLLMIRPPSTPAVWDDDPPPLRYELPVQWKIAELVNLEFDVDQTGNSVPKLLSLAPEAKPVWKTYYDDHHQIQESLSGVIRAAWSKLAEIPARLALVLQLAISPEAEFIERSTLEQAIRLTDWFKNEAERVYADISLTDLQRGTQRTIELIRYRGGRARVRDLQSWDRRFKKSATAAETELQFLVDAGYGIWEPVAPGPNGGRGTREFVLLEVDDSQASAA